MNGIHQSRTQYTRRELGTNNTLSVATQESNAVFCSSPRQLVPRLKETIINRPDYNSLGLFVEALVGRRRLKAMQTTCVGEYEHTRTDRHVTNCCRSFFFDSRQFSNRCTPYHRGSFPMLSSLLYIDEGWLSGLGPPSG